MTSQGGIAHTGTIDDTVPGKVKISSVKEHLHGYIPIPIGLKKRRGIYKIYREFPDYLHYAHKA